MDIKHDKLYRSEGNLSWAGVLKLLLVLAMAVLFFFLAESMVHHHFFSGGAQDYHNTPTGP